MTKKEINRKFDEIVDFSGVAKFIDTPVKRYSSGMTVRLAFAVAAHLEPEILLIDEVLAVGDIEFQRKCLGKMNDVATSGRTVLFVSHNMEAIEYLCHTAILLNQGNIIKRGNKSEVVRNYLELSSQGLLNNTYQSVIDDTRDGKILNAEILNNKLEVQHSFLMGEEFIIKIEFYLKNDEKSVEIGMGLINDKGTDIAAPNSRQQHGTITGKKGNNTVFCRWKKPVLTPRQYFFRIDIGNYYKMYDSVSEAISFSVEPRDIFKTGWGVNPALAVVSDCEWSVQ